MSGSKNKCVAVVIPCYNAELHIQEAIESCFMQPEVAEVIVTDDASTDRSVEVIKTLQDKYLNLSLMISDSKEHKGPATMRNRALEQVTQPFVTFLDADDYYLEGRFEKSLDRLLKDPNLDVVYSPAINVRIGYEGLAEFAEEGEILMTQQFTGIPIEDFILSNSAYGITSILIRKKSLDNIGWFDEELLYAEDTDLHFRILCRLHCHFERDTEMIMICRRIHGENMSHKVQYAIESHKRFVSKNLSVLKEINSYNAKMRITSAFLHRIYPSGRMKLVKKLLFLIKNLHKDYVNLIPALFYLTQRKLKYVFKMKT